MSETNEQTTESTETQEAPQMSRKDALLGSLQAVKACQSLIRGGHFAGNKAHKITVCLGYLASLEAQIKATLDAE